MRKKTIEKAYAFVTDRENGFTEDEQRDFWSAYEVNLHRLVSGSSDETKELWLECLYVTGQEYEDFQKTYGGKEERAFTPRFLFEEIAGTEHGKKENKYFYQFCNNIFLQNTGIVYDSLEKKLTEKNGHRSSVRDYAKEYWHQMYCLSQFKNPFLKDDKTCNVENEEVLFQFLNPQENDQGKREFTSVNDWYQKLLECIVGVISQKYHAKEINIALLTELKNQGKGYDIQLMDIVEAKISSFRVNKEETRYCIKNRVLEALKTTEEYDLLSNGYFLEADDSGEEKPRPYMVAFFDAPKRDSPNGEAVGPERDFVRVYLYVSIEKQEGNHDVLFTLRLILREIMTHRNRIVRCLEKDFAGDLYARYTRKNGEQNILSHEKANSHNATGDDRVTLEVFMSEEKRKDYYDVLKLPEMKDWLLLRNYTNGQIAKMFNRSFQDFRENNNSTNSPALYLERTQKETPDMFEHALIKFSDMEFSDCAEKQEKGDSRIPLLKTVLDIRYDKTLEEAQFVCNREKKYYNLEYFRCILIDIFFSAIKYKVGETDFLSRIDILLKNRNNIAAYQQQGNEWMMKDEILKERYERLKDNCCVVVLSREPSPFEGIDYLVVQNVVDPVKYPMSRCEKENDYIHHRLQSPLDFADGHMSLLTIKRYIENLNESDKIECKFKYERETDKYGDKVCRFRNYLPVLKKEKI